MQCLVSETHLLMQRVSAGVVEEAGMKQHWRFWAAQRGASEQQEGEIGGGVYSPASGILQAVMLGRQRHALPAKHG